VSKPRSPTIPTASGYPGHLLFLVRLCEQFPALSVIVLYRSMVGIELIPLGPFLAISVTILVAPEIVVIVRDIAAWFVPIIAYLPAPVVETSPTLTVYALALPLMVVYRRWQFMNALRNGNLWHAESRGLSPLERLTNIFPRLRLSHVYGVVEPLALFIVGFLTARTISTPLGIWWMLSALSLAAFERGKDQSELHGYLATINAVLEERHRRYVSGIVDGVGTMPAGQRGIAQSGGISTGIALDIAPMVQLIAAERVPPIATRLASSLPSHDILDAE